MERKFWAKLGKRVAGPHASVAEAVAAFRAAHPVQRPSERGQLILTGYGEYGPHFDMQWERREPR